MKRRWWRRHTGGKSAFDLIWQTFQKSRHCRAVGTARGSGDDCPPNIDTSVNPIPTRWKLGPDCIHQITTRPPPLQIYRPFCGPALHTGGGARTMFEVVNLNFKEKVGGKTLRSLSQSINSFLDPPMFT